MNCKQQIFINFGNFLMALFIKFENILTLYFNCYFVLQNCELKLDIYQLYEEGKILLNRAI